MTPRCGQRRAPIRVGAQVEQAPTCHLPAGHDGPHAAVILDSDDNPITERWPR
ncbi:hypothetical protein EDD28_2432 [Salana multivorans]|uniref:Uncharacterized protein n=1 Tax=Salana multivorans TaxID=120377 RepID=A0A3N2DDG8_9MICO|nr:hypothetical protein [Salana multivorans]ROR97823.1 hypothetical protein EDD28_2432 [Salana multivorans]